MKTLHVSVIDKIATYRQRDGVIVCGNSDYQIEFEFDGEWDAYDTKMARFVSNGTYEDVEFTGNICRIPEMRRTGAVEVGVYVAGTDVSTTTGALIPCAYSIKCSTDNAKPEYIAPTAELILASAESTKIAAEEANASAEEASIDADGAKASAESARVSAEEAKASAEEAVNTLSSKLDMINNTTGSEAVYVQRTDNTVMLRNIADSPAPTTIPRRTGTGAVRTATPTEDNHAVNLQYLTDHYGTHEKRLFVIETDLGIDDRFSVIDGEYGSGQAWSVPSNAKRYARISKLGVAQHGYSDPEFGELYTGYSYCRELYANNSNSEDNLILRITASIMAEPGHAMSTASVLCHPDNYLYFDDDNVMIHYAVRWSAKNTLEAGETLVAEASNRDGSGYLIRLASPIENKVGGYITLNNTFIDKRGFMDLSGISKIVVKAVQSEYTHTSIPTDVSKGFVEFVYEKEA